MSRRIVGFHQDEEHHWVAELECGRHQHVRRSVLVEGNTAIIFGTSELRFANPGKDDVIQTLRYTSTYVKRDGRWRMLALQMQQRAPQ